MQGTTVNGYSLVSLIGRGGMAEVWKAQNSLGVSVAIKVLNANLSQDANIVERFRGEARIMASLRHTNIREVRDLATLPDGRPCIIMEYLEGADLASRMKSGERFTDAQLRKWWNQMVSALNYTHLHGVIHRDIKPSNIFVTDSGDVKLLDFGIAKNADNHLSTMTGAKMGTLMYMSPEQVKDAKHIDEKSDVYSLAVTFVHLVSGRSPYASDTSEYGIMTSIVNTPLDISVLPEPWKSFLKPYLEKNPILRPDLKKIVLGTQSGTTTSYKSTSMSGGETKIDVGQTKIENETPLEFKVYVDSKKLSNFPAKGDVTYIQVKTNGEPSLLVPKDSWIRGSKLSSTKEGVFRYALNVQKNTSSSWRKQDIKVVATNGNDTKEETLTVFQQKKTSLWWLWLILAIIGVIILVTAINKNKPTRNNYSNTQSTYKEKEEYTNNSENIDFNTNNVIVTKSSGSIGGHDYVDLGLSVKWATCNVGASSPEQCGGYYAWGETSTKATYEWTNYRFRTSGDHFHNVKLSKYNKDVDYGPIDNRTILETKDDAATSNWGKGWRMPTKAELEELKSRCSWERTGKGYKVTGPNGNSIFLPAIGSLVNDSFDTFYWSSSLDSYFQVNAGSLRFDFNSHDICGVSRYNGAFVRPVHN